MDWISVDFAVPPNDKEVLVLVSHGDSFRPNITIGHRMVYKNGVIKWIGIYSFGRRVISSTRQKNNYRNVTHWMPLPEFPERPLKNS